VIFVLPGSGGGFEGFDLAQPHELLLGRLGNEGTALPASDQHVDIPDKLV